MPIVSFIPLLMFAILFGLSMDYNVFLQSRIREEYMNGATPRESVIAGLSRVGRLILAAGAIMTAVFFGFATDPDPVVKIFGVGLGVAIMIDVLIVRMVVAPGGDDPARATGPGGCPRGWSGCCRGSSSRARSTPRRRGRARDRRRAPFPSGQPAPADARDG